MKTPTKTPKSWHQANVTLRDIAERTGFSKFTVSHALRGNRSEVGEETMEQIIRTAQQMGYNADTAYQARRLALQRGGKHVLNKVVGLFFPVDKLDRAYFREFLRGVTATLRDESFNLLINCSPINANVVEMMPMLARGEVDGIILMANMRLFWPRYEELRKLPGFGDRPVVTVIDPMDGCSGVLADDEGGAVAATAHLLELGHRRILHFWHHPHGDDTLSRRLRGASLAAADFGLEPENVLLCAPRWNQQQRAESFEIVRTMLEQHPDITAILAPNDVGALWIAEFLEQLGRQIPQDISLVGYDDTDPLWNRDHENILTSIHVPLREIGQRAAKLVVEQAAEERQAETSIVLNTRLLIRESTSAPRPR